MAAQLKHLRKITGISGNQLAKNIGWAQSKVSRIETGTQLPCEADLASWCNFLSISKGEQGSLLQLLEQAEAEYDSWRTHYRTAGSSKNKQLEIKNLEEGSSRIVEFQLSLVPGLLQTYDYASAILTAEFGPSHFGADTDDIEETIAVRMERQSILYNINKELSFILPESCLRTVISSKVVHIAQIQRLLDAAALPNTTISILPFYQRMPLIPINGFSIYDQDIVIIETLSGEQQLNSPSDIDLYRSAYSACLKVSLKNDDAACYLRKIKQSILEDKRNYT